MFMPRVELRRLPTIQVLPQESRVGARLARVAARRQGRNEVPTVTIWSHMMSQSLRGRTTDQPVERRGQKSCRSEALMLLKWEKRVGCSVLRIRLVT